jgi:mono/diheme cytochrome c family protein
MKRLQDLLLLGWLVCLIGLAPAPPAHGQGHVGHGQAQPAAPNSIRITMDALHAGGGVPPGWRFSIPPGDAVAGRQAFIDFKCYACHAVKGEQFPMAPGETAAAGPELTGMGSSHPPAYLAESILNPSAVVIDSPGYVGGDGRSIMPTYPDMTLGQLINLVAYLQSFRAPEAAHTHESAREQVVAGYRVRLLFRKAAAHDHGHGGPTSPGQRQDRLLVFLTDSVSGQPIPYATVSARIEAPGRSAQMIKLVPSFGSDGFHYGADLAIPEASNRITLSIGATTMQLGRGAPEGLKRPQRVTFPRK